MNRRSQAVAVLLLALALAGAAGATPVAYTDRSAWDADVGGDVFLEDFDQFVSDASFASSPVDVGPFTIEQGGGNPALPAVNLVDATPFGFSGDDSVNGSSYVLGFVNTTAGTIATSTFITLLFDAPVAAWGADFVKANENLGLDLYLIPSDAQDPSDWVFFDAASAGNGFFGFVDTAAVYAGVVIAVGGFDVGGSGERFGFDNVSGATIPEPASAALLGLGLVGVALARRRR